MTSTIVLPLPINQMRIKSARGHVLYVAVVDTCMNLSNIYLQIHLQSEGLLKVSKIPKTVWRNRFLQLTSKYTTVKNNCITWYSTALINTVHM